MSVSSSAAASTTALEPEDARPFVRIRDVRKVYGERGRQSLEALAEVSLDIRQGEFVSLLGPSGCGKSTLLMLVAGLMPVSAGSIAIDGRTVTGPQTDIGIVFQSPVLLPWKTAIGNVLMQIQARRLDEARYRQRAEELLESVGLAGFRDSYPWQLSGGMQQRVSICRALVHDPPLLLMDEPFGALDALTRDQMTVELQRLWQRSRKTILFVTHSIAEAVFLSDRVVVMSPRPGCVDRVIDVDLPRPRKLRMMGDPAFRAYTDEVTGIFKSRGVIQEEDE